MRAPHALTSALVVVVLAQAGLGLLLPDVYRDVAWIRATWFGNDAVTLFLALPLMVRALGLVARGSRRGHLLWLGLLGYGVYNYAFYLLGAALNAHFALYVAAFVLSAAALILALAHLDIVDLARGLSSGAPVRLLGGYLVFVGVGLTTVWLGMWAAHVFAGRPTPVEPEAFRLVAALDLSLMVPTLVTGGLLLWRRHAWGVTIAAIAAVQGALYLVVLSVNAVIFITRGLSTAPGELPIWGPLAVLTTAAACALLAAIRDDRS
jgi:hypothetical protein